ncbi:threonine/serine ThrE exporter family protein [Kangiella taiwanensis]|uniref:Threonine/serine exporter family protein n=1 Tax=Kangiella taiwanensis TaxID=1079179 RepID=A0ABP8HXS7_9GAMM|nr:threonine/serine exporter family protein [Kangiella taiwanensis]
MADDLPISIAERRLDNVPNYPDRHEPVGFMLRLVKALHTYGVPSYELERLMTNVADQLGYGLQATVVPTSITMTFIQDEDKPRTYVIRSNSGEVNVDKLSRTIDVAYAVINGEITTEKGAKELTDITNSAPLHSKWWMILCFMLVSTAICRIFGGGIPEIITASVTGLIVGVFVNIGGLRSETVSNLMPALSAFLATLISFAFNYWIGLSSTYIPVVSGIIVLVPGMMLTIAMAELATQNLVSGTARLLGSVVIFIQMIFGVAIGSQVAAIFFGQASITTSIDHQLPQWTVWIAIVVSSWSLMMLFQTRSRHLLWVIATTASSFFVSRWAGAELGAATGAFFGALTVGVFANLAYRIKQVPTAAVMMPGFIILVPGSVGFRSLTEILDHNIIGGLETAFNMIIVGISLITGLLVSSIATLPKPKIKTEPADVEVIDNAKE